METSPAKSPVTYKRRRSGRPLSELPWNTSDIVVDPESAVFLTASDDEGVENVTPAKNRKRRSDQLLPKRVTRSSTTPGGDSTTLTDRALRVFGTGKKRNDKENEKGKVVERTPTKEKEIVDGKGIEKTPRKDTEKDKGKSVDRTPTPRKHMQGESGFLYSPIEFVMEKRAMFAEIDAFELESEEEEPEEKKTTGIEMLSESSGETTSPEPSKGEVFVEPGQSTQDATNTKELSKGETSVQPTNVSPEQSTEAVTTADDVSRGDRAVPTGTRRLEQSTEEVTITVEVGEKDDG